MYNKEIGTTDIFLYKELLTHTNSPKVRKYIIKRAVLRCRSGMYTEFDIIKELGVCDYDECCSFEDDLREITEFLRPKSLYLWGQEWMVLARSISFPIEKFLNLVQPGVYEFVSFEYQAYCDKQNDERAILFEPKCEINDINDYKLFKCCPLGYKDMQKYNCYVDDLLNDL